MNKPDPDPDAVSIEQTDAVSEVLQPSQSENSTLVFSPLTMLTTVTKMVDQKSKDVQTELKTHANLRIKTRKRPEFLFNHIAGLQQEPADTNILISFNPTVPLDKKGKGTNYPYFNLSIPFTPNALLSIFRTGAVVLGELKMAKYAKFISKDMESMNYRKNVVDAEYDNLPFEDACYRNGKYQTKISAVMFDFDFKYGHGTYNEVEQLVSTLPFQAFLFTSNSYGTKAVKSFTSEATRLLIPFSSVVSGENDIISAILNLEKDLVDKYGFDRFKNPPFGTYEEKNPNGTVKKSPQEFDSESTERSAKAGYWAPTQAVRWTMHAGQYICAPNTNSVEVRTSTPKNKAKYEKALDENSQLIVRRAFRDEENKLGIGAKDERTIINGSFTRNQTINTGDEEVRIGDLVLAEGDTIRFHCNEECCASRERSNSGTNALLSYNEINGLYTKWCFSSGIRYIESVERGGKYTLPQIVRNYPLIYRDVRSASYFHVSACRNYAPNPLNVKEFQMIMKQEALDSSGYDGTYTILSLSEIFDPTVDYQIDFEAKTINFWKPTEYMLTEIDKDTLFDSWDNSELLHHIPTIWNLICNIAPNPEERNWLLNWIATAFNTRQKLTTCPIWRGIEGSGKNQFFIKVLQPLFGRRYTVIADQDRLDSKFNDWFANRVLVLWDELSHDTKDERNANAEKLKTYVSNITFEKEGKNAKVVSGYPNYANSIITSNHDFPITISPSDRRYTIIDSQWSQDMVTTDWFNKLGSFAAFDKAIENEVPLFGVLLRHFQYNMAKANFPLMTEQKAAISDLTTNKFTILVKAIRNKNMQYFDEFYDEYSDSPYFVYFPRSFGINTTPNEKRKAWLDEMKKQLDLGRVSVRVLKGMVCCLYEQNRRGIVAMFKNKGMPPHKYPIDGDRHYITDPVAFGIIKESGNE
jgi:hypothetical protein